MSQLVGKIFSTFRRKTDDAMQLARSKQPLTYDQARVLASHADPEVRRVLACRPDLPPEILYFLAEDPAPLVRRQIAANRAAPAQADYHLAGDADASVRGDLAQKIAHLAPGLSADEQDRLRQITYQTLQLLARDQITRVRKILADALKDVADAPPQVIRQLAHDGELAVASPILEFSPVLSDEDLLEIIGGAPMAGVLSAISRRKVLGAAVADGIAKTDDIEAISFLLSNPRAQIREETLDMLLDQAPDIEAWHGPFVHRPQLSARAATRLARFVADNLLRVLDQRQDFDAKTKAAVAAVVRRRVEDAGSDMVAFRRGEPLSAVPPEPVETRVSRLQSEGKLDDKRLVDGLTANDNEFVMHALARLAGVSVNRVNKIVTTQSAKGIVSLTWKAGLSMQTAVALQTKLAKIPPPDLLLPRPGSKAFPMALEEMAWQLEFFASMVGDSAK
ncbi:DUF2336 domain-containing protein [Telmatospirillum sp.]|uniref:DUF2336 domain-containing protein n=1 Tax=Telmatospirillum sp. TaxID=2079197 RepID=UPI0028508585|nr:DUF2336 domain-containing protein [Telmatospirillum sp.]MDR3439200.1 DUF2336 domain-containing protein [Telmatospirillum sp.]